MRKEPKRPERSQRCSQCGNAQSHDLYDICPAELGTAAWDPCDFDTCPRQKVPGTDYCSGHQYPDEPFDWAKLVLGVILFGGIAIGYIFALTR